MSKIFINPGHSPQWELDAGITATEPEPGACCFGLQENIIAASVGALLEKECTKYGIGIAGNLQSSSLYEITDTANATDADVLVSIHCNAASAAAKGTETFYCAGSSTGRKIAECVQKNLISTLGTVDRGVKDDMQTQHGRIHVLRQSDMAAILIELAFISNEGDADLLQNNQADFAKAIAKGLAEYFGLTLPAPDVVDKPAEPPINAVAKHSESPVNVEVIGSLSAKYESSGDPACVANNAGDLGGISYGKYQFASKVGSVDKFVDWLCKYPDDKLANYGRVLAAHAVNSSEFIRQWQELGTVDPGNFGKLQDEYMIQIYYNGAADKLRKENFNLEKHSDALKAVVFSRAVQNGQSGCKDLFLIACKKLGQPNLSYIDDAFFDGKIISAIYDFLISECDLAMPVGGIWRSPDDFCHGSKHIIDALRSRFTREKQDALDLL